MILDESTVSFMDSELSSVKNLITTIKYAKGYGYRQIGDYLIQSGLFEEKEFTDDMRCISKYLDHLESAECELTNLLEWMNRILNK